MPIREITARAPAHVHDEIRPGEVAVPPPEGGFDAGLWYIGVIRTPWTKRGECPRKGSPDGPVCRIEVDPRWAAALEGVRPGGWMQVLYWMDRARRDLVRQAPRHDGGTLGTFALRSPIRPNPIASSVVSVEAVEGCVLSVRGLDCLDGTPLLDLKPETCPKA